MTVGANAPTSVVFDTPHIAVSAFAATCGSNRSARLDGGAHTTPAALTRARQAAVSMLARCHTLSLTQLIAAVDAPPPATVIDAVLELVETGVADLYRHRVDGHLVVGTLATTVTGARR